MNKFSLGLISGIVLACGAVAAYDATRFVMRAEPVLATPVAHVLTAYDVDPTWVSSGKPVFKTTETSRSADGKTVSGLWSCEGPTTFEWRYDVDETIHVLEGEAEVEYLGHKVTLRSGDVYTFHTGTRAKWQVKGFIKKSWAVHTPNAIGAWWRGLRSGA